MRSLVMLLPKRHIANLCKLHHNAAGSVCDNCCLARNLIYSFFLYGEPALFCEAATFILRLFVFISCDWLPDIRGRHTIYSDLHESDPCDDEWHMISSYSPCNYHIQLRVIDHIIKVWYATQIHNVCPNAKFGKPRATYRYWQV